MLVTEQIHRLRIRPLGVETICGLNIIDYSHTLKCVETDEGINIQVSLNGGVTCEACKKG